MKRSDKDQPLIDDIRLLGRILGDVIREQEGVEAYELVEQVRKLSVAFRRDADQEADRALKKLLKSLSGDQTVSVIRAFTYFSHLANLAEDRHHIRRRAIHERAGNTQEGSIEVALQRLRWAGITPRTVAATLAHSFVSPVLTAHPTEVQRKSILDAERNIANLLTERDEIHARAAAAGWGGDRYLALDRDPVGAAPLIVGLIAWDSEADAGEFEATWRLYLEKVMKDAFILQRRGDQLLFAAQVRDAATRDAIASHAWSAFTVAGKPAGTRITSKLKAAS
mgnify:CR=1 FL=1